MFTLGAMLTATATYAAADVEQQLVGTWFIEVGGVLPDGGKYQNIMNVDEGGTADIVGGWMFGAAGTKFTDSPASVVSTDGGTFVINMFAFLADAQTGAPSALNVTVYRGTMQEGGESFTAEADLYYLPCTVERCPAPDPGALGTPATVAQVTGVKLATPFSQSN
ncbi:MAG: hypothetical protein AB3N24_03090 [Leisingera sp.]